MKIIGTMPVRNEDWVLGASLRAALMWMDGIAVGLHACTDDSAEIVGAVAREFPGRIRVITHAEEQWSEMAHRQALLEAAREMEATHIAIVDADEILTANALQSIRAWFERTPKGRVLQVPWLQLRSSLNRYHATGLWAEQMVSIGFADSPELHWSSAGRGGYDFHHRHPMGRPLPPFQLAVPKAEGMMHLQMVSGRRLRAKQALYKMTEVLRWPGREPIDVVDRRYNYAVYGQETPNRTAYDGLRECPPVWWSGYELLLPAIDVHAEPWQEVEVYRLLKEYGPRPFAGLDLFGLGEGSFHVR